MMNWIWLAMIAASLMLAVVNGKIDAVTGALLESAGEAVKLCISLLGVICLWSGFIKIAQRSGLITLISKAVKPLLSILFPALRNHDSAMGAIMMNLSANFLGMGNAATPLGLKAMSELQKLNRGRQDASDEMCMFLVLNASAIQLVPATIIAVRTALGSSRPAVITAAIWAASSCACIAGITAARLLAMRRAK